VNDEIDAAYHANYDRYSARYVDPMVGPEVSLRLPIRGQVDARRGT